VRSASRILKSENALDAGLTFGPFCHGRGDPASRLNGNEWWQAMNSPEGDVTIRVHVDRPNAEVRVDAWGPGRDWVIERAPHITGEGDEPASFTTDDPLLRALHRDLRGLRIVRLRCAFDFTVATIIEQRVTSREAHRSWRALVRRHGVAAPGGNGLVVPPPPRILARLPDWEWRRLGVELRRSSTVRRLAIEATRIERAADTNSGVLTQRLVSINGIGPWTSAQVLHMIAGDPDAVPVGDWHLPAHVAYALAGERDADDARMLELLEPFRPQRARALRLIIAGTAGPERRAPRARIQGLLHAEAARRYI
jgi:3-methyladenine DNA glycosylase/8-oxoguanine DNA glycosylase